MVPPGAGAGDVGVVVMDSNGRRDTVEIVLENKGDSIFRCTYIPVLQGAHTIYVTFAGQQIPRSPFTVHISEGWFGSFKVFVVPHLKVIYHLVVQYEGQNFLHVVYSRSGLDRSSVMLKVGSLGSSGPWCSTGSRCSWSTGARWSEVVIEYDGHTMVYTHRYRLLVKLHLDQDQPQELFQVQLVSISLDQQQ